MKATRLNDIENLLEEQNTLSINHLCEIFNVSKNTKEEAINLIRQKKKRKYENEKK